MIFNKATYRGIAFGFLTLFLSLLFIPTIVVAAIDEDVNISMYFSFTEEETKEHEVKCELDVDDFFPTNYLLLARSFDSDLSRRTSIDNFLNSLYDPGIIVPPPEFN